MIFADPLIFYLMMDYLPGWKNGQVNKGKWDAGLSPEMYI